MKRLTSSNTIGVIGPFVGSKHLLIIGSGTVVVEKSIDKGDTYYPMTDGSGDVVELQGSDVLYNAKIDNDNGDARYRLALVDGTVEYGVL